MKTSLSKTLNKLCRKRIREFSLLWIILSLPTLIQAADICFQIENLRNNKGKVFIGIYDKAETFPSRGGYIVGCFSEKEIADQKVSITCSIKPGLYAAAMFHDENANEDFDTNFLGVPKEGYGFSRNPDIGFSLPDFTEAAFEVQNENLELIIRMKY
jgi:uncharacterized protein (DUF2141 family)